MAKFRGTILAARSGRRGGRQQYILGHGKGPGRRMSRKVMAPEPLPYQPARLTATPCTKTEIRSEQKLQALKEQAQTIKARLCYLEKRIRDIEPRFMPTAFKASVNPEMCVGCGICQDVCPAGAISVDEIARVDPKRCIGCGLCIEQCPRGALALHPLNTGFKEQVCAAL